MNNVIRKFQQLQKWFKSPLGMELADHEQDQLDKVLQRLFGFHLLQLGRIIDQDLLWASPINHHFIMGFDDLLKSSSYALEGELKDLPFLEDSIDVVFLPHLLEFIKEPEAFLAEASRVLIPEGSMIILGFNSGSQWGIYRWFRRHGKKVPWNGRFRNIYRMRKLLSQAGCEVTEYKTFFFRPPLGREFFLKRFKFLESLGQIAWPYFGGAYIMVAKKQVSTMTTIKTKWRIMDFLRRKTYAEPTHRGMRNNNE